VVSEYELSGKAREIKVTRDLVYLNRLTPLDHDVAFIHTVQAP